MKCILVQLLPSKTEWNTDSSLKSVYEAWEGESERSASQNMCKFIENGNKKDIILKFAAVDSQIRRGIFQRSPN